MTTEPVVDVATEVLVGKADEADRPFDKLTAEEVFLVEPEIVIDTVARTPFELAFAFEAPGGDTSCAACRVVAGDGLAGCSRRRSIGYGDG